MLRDILLCLISLCLVLYLLSQSYRFFFTLTHLRLGHWSDLSPPMFLCFFPRFCPICPCFNNFASPMELSACTMQCDIQFICSTNCVSLTSEQSSPSLEECCTSFKVLYLSHTTIDYFIQSMHTTHTLVCSCYNKQTFNSCPLWLYYSYF